MTIADADQSIAAALGRLGEGPQDERVRLGEALAALEVRAHGLALVLLGAANLLPGPSLPGYSTVFGLPLCLVAGQLALGRRRLGLPGALARIGIQRGRLAAALARVTPLLDRVERAMTPRLPALVGPGGERLVGLVCFILGLAIIVPIPIYPMLPALAVVIAAAGLLARDGLAVVAGFGVGAVALAVLAGLIWAAVAVID